MSILVWMAILLLLATNSINAETSQESSSSANEDEYCGRLESAFESLTQEEQRHFRQFALSASPIDSHGETLYLLHPRLKGSCKDRFRLGALLSRIASGTTDAPAKPYIEQKTIFIIETIGSLWRGGAIINSDLRAQRELILVYDGFNPSDRVELIQIALDTEGLSHPVIYSIWSSTDHTVGRIVDQLEQMLENATSADCKMLLGLTLTRMGAHPLKKFDFEAVLREMGLSDEKTGRLHGIFEGLLTGREVSFRDLDVVGILPDD
jgi:hypothetical protein